MLAKATFVFLLVGLVQVLMGSPDDGNKLDLINPTIWGSTDPKRNYFEQQLITGFQGRKLVSSILRVEYYIDDKKSPWISLNMSNNEKFMLFSSRRNQQADALILGPLQDGQRMEIPFQLEKTVQIPEGSIVLLGVCPRENADVRRCLVALFSEIKGAASLADVSLARRRECVGYTMAYAQVAAKTAGKTTKFAMNHRNNAEGSIKLGKLNHVPAESAFTLVTQPLGLSSLNLASSSSGNISVAPITSPREGDAKKILKEYLLKKQRDLNIPSPPCREGNVDKSPTPANYTSHLPLKAKDKLAVKSRINRAKQSTGDN